MIFLFGEERSVTHWNPPFLILDYTRTRVFNNKFSAGALGRSCKNCYDGDDVGSVG